MVKSKGFTTYKKYWEEQDGFTDKDPWAREKIAKLTISNDFENNLQELKFSDHSLSKEDGRLTIRLQIPYNYYEVDDFKSKTIELLGIEKQWLIDFALEASRCSHLVKSK